MNLDFQKSNALMPWQGIAFFRPYFLRQEKTDHRIGAGLFLSHAGGGEGQGGGEEGQRGEWGVGTVLPPAPLAPLAFLPPLALLAFLAPLALPPRV